MIKKIISALVIAAMLAAVGVGVYYMTNSVSAPTVVPAVEDTYEVPIPTNYVAPEAVG